MVFSGAYAENTHAETAAKNKKQAGKINKTFQTPYPNAPWRAAAEIVPPAAVVPFGSVPFMTIVCVPLAIEIVTRVLFSVE